MEANWNQSIEPLLKQYKGRQHPLDYKNRYQLVVMVILSAQDSDKHINEVAKEFFKKFPSMEHLAAASVEEIQRLIGSVRNFGNKSAWLSALAKAVGTDSKIPHTLDELTKLPGIGRKSANVIIRESGDKAEGVIVDLHVLRVAPRLGVAEGTKPEKIEKQLMSVFPQDKWNEVGMAMSFLGRETCRPTNPKCFACVMNTVCVDYKFRKSNK
ncbi:endonuclease III [Tenuifilaceae bacterium CYCD]|nr:endonuclease III [Tenuifilaceae bacterium CYCD]